MRMKAYAKINLHLRVGPIQTDGYHPVNTWMVTVGLFDMLDFSLDTAGRVELTSSDPNLPVDESNLIIRAIRQLKNRILQKVGQNTGKSTLGARVHLHKQIPTGGGLGGGSSDAASTLIAINDLWSLKLSRQQLTELAAEIGSDVAFFTQGPSSICTGRGELITPIPVPIPRWALLMLPNLSMPTPAVYKQFDLMEPDRKNHGSCDWDQPIDWKQWIALSATELLPLLRNDLERPAFVLCPRLGELRLTLEQELDRPVRLSGSGSSLLTLYDTESEADAAREKIQHRSELKTIVAHVAPDEVIG